MGDGQSNCRSACTDGSGPESAVIDTLAVAAAKEAAAPDAAAKKGKAAEKAASDAAVEQEKLAADEEKATKLAGVPGEIKTKLEGRQKSMWQDYQGESQVATSMRVIEAMLEQEDFSVGQQEDLNFVLRTLQRQHAGQNRKSSIQCALAHAKEYSSIDLEFFAQFAEADVVRKSRNFRDAAKGVRFAMGLSRKVKMSTLWSGILGEDDPDRKWMQHWNSWNEFNIFEASEMCGPSVLEKITTMMFKRSNLMQRFNLSRTRLVTFISAIETKYKANPYHNATHAADTMQTVFFMIQALRTGSITELEQLAMLIASACHDVGHPGVTNAFRIAAMDEGAIAYNDISINENMHCALTFQTLREPDCAFTDPFSKKQFAAVRKLMIGIILSTDMAFHFGKLDALKDDIADKGKDLEKWDSLTPVIQMMVHAADVSNPTRSTSIAKKWSDRVTEEFFDQGDQEKKLGYDISPMCNRLTVMKSESLCGFMDFIVGPTFENLNVLVDLSLALANFHTNKAIWKEQGAKDKKAKADEQIAIELAKR